MAKRAKNGMGSIRKRSDGTWEGRYTAPDGRQRSVYAKDSKALTAKLRAAQARAITGALEPSKMTLGAWLEMWLREYKSGLAPNTIDLYKASIKRITASCGAVKLRDIKPMHAARLEREMREHGYSVGVQRNTLVILVGALRQAHVEGLIPEVPPIPLPRNREKPLTIIDRPAFATFAKAAKETRYGNVPIFLLLTGIRIGELRGLKWEDVDLEAGTIHVCRQIGRLNGQYYEAPPKRGEERTIVLPAEAVRILNAQRITQAEDKLRAGAEWSEEEIAQGRVFRQTNGRPHTQESLSPTFKAISQAMGAHITPHTLRHSSAVAALRSGTDPKTVQHNLGHRSAAMTLDVYARYTSDAGAEGAKRLGEFWQNATNQGGN